MVSCLAMIDLLRFFCLGFVFGFSIKIVDFVEHIFSSKILSFMLDFITMILWALASFCAVIVINEGNIRTIYFIMEILGIMLYFATIHRLIGPLFSTLSDKLCRRHIRHKERLKNRTKSFKKVLQLK